MKNSRILIAESDPALCDIDCRFFSRQGFEVNTAAHGLECLAKLREVIPDVLVLEWEMPWGGGDGVLALLREEFSLLPSTVVVVTSGQAVENLSIMAPRMTSRLDKEAPSSHRLIRNCATQLIRPFVWFRASMTMAF